VLVTVIAGTSMTDLTPDGVPCRHCGKPISWDETCWTHDANGFADCGLVVLAGTGVQIAPGIVTDPQFAVEHKYKGKMAEPIGEWT
jgi:hypothetical protein